MTVTFERIVHYHFKIAVRFIRIGKLKIHNGGVFVFDVFKSFDFKLLLRTAATFAPAICIGKLPVLFEMPDFLPGSIVGLIVRSVNNYIAREPAGV